jgi:hypothetical protein
VGNGIVSMAAGDFPTAIEAGRAMKIRVEHVEAIL